MDFSKVKSLTIPEGNVTQITDASGRVLWSAVKPMVTVTLEGYGSISLCYVVINGIQYSYGPTTIEVPSGTIIECYAASEADYAPPAWIEVNGERVAESDYSSQFSATYSHIVTCNTKVHLTEDRTETGYGKFYHGHITITEE